ncbi:sugar transferase [Tenggerimyces flavus]|uniref:Sugar transferase n=1 Tax=Tenggerimyces flavus TaxID=1708749 RepID=A0ABV7YA18_9ACTN|nr:sugar transferase [Tenggerimyces flavus]MBM7785650.1 exopolysaccharide biosynthesis polyprenyl glycosylphosphotransferase [Tenggerimyces flavus]
MSVSEIPRPLIQGFRAQRTAVAHGSRAWERRYQRQLVALDLALVALAGWLAYVLRFGFEAELKHVAIAVVLPFAWLVAMQAGRGYEQRYLYVGSDEYRRVLAVGATLIALLATVSYATMAEISRIYMVTALVLAAGLDLTGRYALRRILHHRWRSGRNLHRVVLVGYERTVAEASRRLAADQRHGLQVVAACLPPDRNRHRLSDVDVPVLGTFLDIPDAVEAARADTVAVLPCPEMDGLALRRLAWELEQSQTRLLISPGLLDVAGPRTTVRPMSGLPLLHVEHAELSGPRRIVKALLDRVLAAVATLVLAPLLLLIALAIHLDSNGSALFRQVRVGKGGKEFVVYKFRTMVSDAEAQLDELEGDDGNGVLFKLRRDPRVTRVGRLLRRTSLDELPQLLNVLRGEMSLVGPRPPLPVEVDRYGVDVRRRLAVRPGITGLWQVSGRSDLSWDESVRLDLTYVENWTFWLDLVILVKTVRAVAKGTGAY